MEPGLFDSTIDEQGKQTLLKIHRWALVFYIAALLTGVFDLIVAGYELKFYLKASERVDSFYFLVNLVYLVVYAILIPVIGYFFYRFSSQSKKAIRANNPHQLNNSLRWLLKHIILAACLFCVNALWAITSIYFVTIYD